MKYKSLVTGLIGFAMLAMPIAAAAQNPPNGRNDSHQSQSAPPNASAHSSAPTHNEMSGNAGRHESRDQNASRPMKSEPATATRNESRDQRTSRTVNTEPATATRNESHANRNVEAGRTVTENREGRTDRGDGRTYGDNGHDRDWNHDHDRDHDRDWNHGHYEDYSYGAPYDVMPQGYAGGACGWARHLRAVYNHDRYTGHPAAAEDLLPRLRRAERACGGVPYGYNGYRY